MYHLDCAACSFERRIDGLERALDVADSHRSDDADHFVNVYNLCADGGRDEADVGDPATAIGGGRDGNSDDRQRSLLDDDG
ncbi:MAG: hypothetical protein ABEJ26_10370 [Halosimplex sp.]